MVKYVWYQIRVLNRFKIDRMLRKIKLLLLSSMFILLGSCSQNNEQEIGDYNYRLVFNNRAVEVIKVNYEFENTDDSSKTDLNLYVNVTNSSKDMEDGVNSKNSNIPGNINIERQLTEILESGHSLFGGVMPIQIEYRTTECKSVRILLYDENDELVSDFTNRARFKQIPRPIDWLDLESGILISSNGDVLGLIPEDCTITEFLSYHPMAFALAHFVIPNANKELFTLASYIKVEIELEDGVISASTRL